MPKTSNAFDRSHLAAELSGIRTCFSMVTTKNENEPSKPVRSGVSVRSDFLGASASNRLQHCRPRLFGRWDVSREHCAGSHTDERRVRDFCVVLFGVHISG